MDKVLKGGYYMYRIVEGEVFIYVQHFLIVAKNSSEN